MLQARWTRRGESFGWRLPRRGQTEGDPPRTLPSSKHHTTVRMLQGQRTTHGDALHNSQPWSCDRAADQYQVSGEIIGAETSSQLSHPCIVFFWFLKSDFKLAIFILAFFYPYTVYRCVLALYTQYTRVLWTKIKGILFGWGLNPWPLQFYSSVIPTRLYTLPWIACVFLYKNFLSCQELSQLINPLFWINAPCFWPHGDALNNIFITSAIHLQSFIIGVLSPIVVSWFWFRI